MSKHRLQVLMAAEEYRELRRFARRHKTTIGACVRRVIAEAIRREPARTVAHKLAVLERAMRHSGPTGDIERMNSEIERGYLSGEWPR